MTDPAATGRVLAHPLRMHHRADPAELSAIRRSVGRWARQWELPEDLVVDLQLALGEAVANGIEHAYRDRERGTVTVDLHVRREPPAVAVRVTDHGRWRPVSAVTGYRGRGLRIIREIGRHVEVVPGPDGTEVCFEIPIPA